MVSFSASLVLAQPHVLWSVKGRHICLRPRLENPAALVIHTWLCHSGWLCDLGQGTRLSVPQFSRLENGANHIQRVVLKRRYLCKAFRIETVLGT